MPVPHAALEVLDPVAPKPKLTVPSAKRIPDLTGRRIGLYWNTKPGGDVGLEEIARLLENKYQKVKFEKFYYRYPVSKATLDKVVKAAPEAIISATGD